MGKESTKSWIHVEQLVSFIRNNLSPQAFKGLNYLSSDLQAKIWPLPNQTLTGSTEGIQWTYTGSVLDGLRHGLGVTRQSNGLVLEGVWLNGKAQGDFKTTTQSGAVSTVKMVDGTVTLTAGGAEVVLDKSSGVTATMSGQKLELSSSGAKLAGMTADVEAQTALTLKGQATAELSASGVTTVKGALVKIN